MAQRIRPASLALAALLLSATGLASCGRPADVVPGDGTVDARVAQLEKELRDLRDAKDSAALATGVSGNETADLRRTIVDLQAQVRDLEDRLALAMTPRAAPSGENGGGPGVPAAPLALPTTFEPGADGSFSDQQVSTFRKLLDEVDRRRTEEAQADRVRRELTRAGVTLTPEQEAAVLRLQQSYAGKMRDIFRGGMGNNEQEREASLAKRDALRAQYESELRTVVPAGDADKIVEAMRRGWPGFFPRRTDGRRGPAGGGD